MPDKRLNAVWRKLQNLSKVGGVAHAMHLIKQAFRSFVISPAASLICLVTVAAAMSILNCFLLLITNVSDVVEDGELGCRIYLKDNAAKERINQELNSYKGLESIKFVSELEAIKEFKNSFGDGLLMGLKDENPLPASFVVTGDSQELISALSHKYQNDPAVEYVQFDRQFAQSFTQAVLLFRRLILISVLALLIVTAVIIANTVRLTLLRRDDEIVIMRLVGAEKMDVVLPAVIEGAIYGILGSLFGLLAAYLIWFLSGELFSDLTIIKLLFPKTSFLSFLACSLIVLVGCFVGSCSSFTAVSKVSEK